MSMYLGGVKVKAVKVGQTIEDVATVATLTQAEYNALPTKNSNTLYAITDAGEDNTVRLVENTSAITLPKKSDWRSICYGNGKFVAVSGNGAAYTTDGITWVQVTQLADENWKSVCYGNEKFVTVAYGSSIAAYSTDGITWTQTTLPGSTSWYSVCYGNGKFVAVNNNSTTAAYSTDGITWTQATLPASAEWKSVCYGNGKFVVVSGDSSNQNSNIAAYSADGTSWTQTTLSSRHDWCSVCYGDGKFVAVANNTNSISYSTDGITWTQATLPASAEWKSVCYGGDKFVAITANGSIAYSVNGTRWAYSTLASSTSSWYSVCYGNGKFIAVSYYNTAAAYSTDGINWVTEVTSRELQNSSGADISEAVKSTLGVSAPKAKLVTLTVAGWDSSAKTQSVTVSGILADESKQMIIPMPATASMTAYNDAGIQCTGQAENTLTFTADTVPTAAIQVYVTYQDVISV